eukprot:365408-Chlamydomonas_euryale.AAC.31
MSVPSTSSSTVSLPRCCGACGGMMPHGGGGDGGNNAAPHGPAAPSTDMDMLTRSTSRRRLPMNSTRRDTNRTPHPCCPRRRLRWPRARGSCRAARHRRRRPWRRGAAVVAGAGRGSLCSVPPGSPSRSGARTSAPPGCAASPGRWDTGTPPAALPARAARSTQRPARARRRTLRRQRLMPPWPGPPPQPTSCWRVFRPVWQGQPAWGW